MASSLSNLVNNLYEETHKIKCKQGHKDKKVEIFRIKFKYYYRFFEHTNFKDDLINVYVGCNKNYQQKFDEKLKKRFLNAYKFSKHDSNNFILLLEKGVYLYEYMDDW